MHGVGSKGTKYPKNTVFSMLDERALTSAEFLRERKFFIVIFFDKKA